MSRSWISIAWCATSSASFKWFACDFHPLFQALVQNKYKISNHLSSKASQIVLSSFKPYGYRFQAKKALLLLFTLLEPHSTVFSAPGNWQSPRSICPTSYILKGCPLEFERRMDNPLKEIVVAITACAGAANADAQVDAFNHYFTADASFLHPLCYVPPRPDSLQRVIGIYLL